MRIAGGDSSAVPSPHPISDLGRSETLPDSVRPAFRARNMLSADRLTLRDAYCYGARQMHRSLFKYLLALIALIAVAGLLYRFRGSITLEGLTWATFWDSMRHARLSLLALSIVAIYGCYAVRALRWARFSQAMGPAQFRGVYLGTIIGFTCVVVLGRVGEPIRPILIARKEKLPVAGMFGVYILERVMDAFATAVLAGIALLAFSRHPAAGPNNDRLITAARTGGAVLFAGLIGMVSFLTYFRLHGARALDARLIGWKSHLGWRAKFAGIASGFGEGLQGIRNFGDLAAGLGYTALHWVMVALVYEWIAWSFGGKLATLTFPSVLLVMAFTMVGSAVQLPGGAGGAQVATFLAYTAVFGIEKGPAAAAAILTWLITFCTVSIVGLPLLFREGWSMGDLRRLAKAEAAAEEAGEHISASAEARTLHD
jgi:uncharacterized membrane protein YbhN (UPF0104 family)